MTSKVKRSVDKKLIAVDIPMNVGGIGTSTLKTTTFPCTITGLRWSLSAQASSVLTGAVYWAIVMVQDGETPNNLNVANTSNYYMPEQAVLAFGAGHVVGTTATAGPEVALWEGSTKAMRKMKQGDQLFFITFGSTAATAQCTGIIQFFCKI